MFSSWCCNSEPSFCLLQYKLFKNSLLYCALHIHSKITSDKTLLPNSIAVDYNIVSVYVISTSASTSCSDGQTSRYEGLYIVNICGTLILPNSLISTLLTSVASLPLLYIYISPLFVSSARSPPPSNCWLLHCYAFKGILLLFMLITSGYALTNGTLNSTKDSKRIMVHIMWMYSQLLRLQCSWI